MLAFFFSLNFFLKNAVKAYFFRVACLCMTRSLSDNSKNQKFELTIIEKFCQKKVCYFCYISCERQLDDNSGRFLCIVKA